MFDDDTGRLCETFNAFPSSVRISYVVIGKLFALQLFGSDKRAWSWVHITVKRSLLMRIFAIAQVLNLDKTAIGLTRKQCLTAVRLNA